MFFPSFIWLADLRFAHGNQELLFFAGMVLLLGTAGVLLMPFWRDRAIALTTKLESSLIVIVANFWMGRAAITTSGGFNCICSLAVGGAVMAILCLGGSQTGSTQSLRWYFAVIGFAFLASFSFGTGLAVWPTLLVLGLSLRLSWRSMGVIFLAGLAAFVIYFLLPGQTGRGTSPSMASSLLPMGEKMLRYLCMLIGAPFLFSGGLELRENLKGTRHYVTFLLSLRAGRACLCWLVGRAKGPAKKSASEPGPNRNHWSRSL